jgi:hypothetical protein
MGHRPILPENCSESEAVTAGMNGNLLKTSRRTRALAPE